MIKKGWARVATAASATLALACVFRRAKGRRRAQPITQGPEPIFEEFDRLTQELGHEIRNPLTAIAARLHNLQYKLPAGSAESREAALIAEEGRRLDGILQDFRHRGAPSVPHLVAVRAGLLLEQVRELFAAEFDPEQITVRCEAAQDVQLMADPQLLKKAAMGHRAAVVFEVVDNGAGVPESVRARLLGPFFSTKERGTGLGLPIAARIVAQHGGQLEFESEPGQGATFRVLLPRGELPT